MPHFEQELERLRQRLLMMASLAERAVSGAMQALVERDDGLAQQVQWEDDRLDRLEMEIDNDAIGLLAKAPLAHQLRAITVTMKISRNLERVGDEATTIARRVVQLNQDPPLTPFPDIASLARAALGLVNRAIGSFVYGDTTEARAVQAQDAVVDAMNQQVYQELVRRIESEPQALARCLHLIVVAKSLERVADHAKNIAEYVVFLREGHEIRQGAHPASCPAAA